MKITFSHSILINTVFLLVGIMVIMIANQTVFIHSHVLSNGQVISHAHPYDKNDDTKPFKSHHHTKSEILFLENVKILFPVIFLLLTVFIFLQKAKHFIYPSFNIYPAIILIKTGRSPPVL
jgi:type III secretory pathway component EscU